MSTKILSSNGNTIICHHPKRLPNIMESQATRTKKQYVQKSASTRLTEDQVDMVRKLRVEDSSVWTVSTLASLFNVRRVDVSRLSPAPKDRQNQLDKDREMLKTLPLRQRRGMLARRETTRQKKLHNYLSQMKYDFPGLNNITN